MKKNQCLPSVWGEEQSCMDVLVEYKVIFTKNKKFWIFFVSWNHLLPHAGVQKHGS